LVSGTKVPPLMKTFWAFAKKPEPEPRLERFRSNSVAACMTEPDDEDDNGLRPTVDICVGEVPVIPRKKIPSWPHLIPFVPAGSVQDPICILLPVVVSTTAPLHLLPSVLLTSIRKPSAYGAEKSTAQLTPGPPSAPDWQFGSLVVVPLMKLLNTAWIMGLPLESGRD